MAVSRGNFVGLTLLGFIAIVVGLLVWQPWNAGPNGNGNSPTDGHGPPPPQLNPLPPPERAQAFELQREQKWCEAEKAWQAVLTEVDPQSEFHVEAERNRDLVASLCKPPKPSVDVLKISPLPEDQRPAEVSEKDITEFYPVGRKIRSLAHLAITGSGTNEEWIFKSEAHFAYLYRMVVETEAVRNSGHEVEFEQRFLEVAQLRADSSQKIEFNLPELPLANLAWQKLEENILNNVPLYTVIKRVGQIAKVLDPRGKKLLTGLHDYLRSNGVKLDDSDEMEMVAKIEKLSGLRTKSVYVSGLGVTEITVLDGQQFDPDDLERLAYQSGLLADYFISRAAEETSGEPFTVRTQDLGSMLNFGYEVTARGEISLRRRDDGLHPDETVMDVVGGEVVVEGNVDGVEHSGTVKPVSGFVRYREKERLVTSARVAWDINTQWFSKDHLLFGTKKLRNVKIESQYDAERVDPEKGKTP